MANTPNLGLHQWDADDAFLRTDFNEDFGRIDAGVGEKCRMAHGVYVGDADSSLEETDNTRDMPLGFTPKAVVISISSMGVGIGGNAHSGMTVEGAPLVKGSFTALKIIPGGFRVGAIRTGQQYYYPSFNQKGIAYSYFAIG